MALDVPTAAIAQDAPFDAAVDEVIEWEPEPDEVAAAEESDLRVELRRGDGLAIEAHDGIFATPLRGLFVRAIDGSGQAAFAGSVSKGASMSKP